MMKLLLFLITLFYFFISTSAYAKSFEDLFQACIFKVIKTSNDDHTLQQIKEYCENKITKESIGTKELGVISERVIKEKLSAFDPYVITPHKMNYILPAIVSDSINTQAYNQIPNWSEQLKDVETKFQLSLKVPLTTSNLLTEGDQLFFSFTLESWWQLYTYSLSRPFRETNYQPELFYFTPIKWHPFDGNTAAVVGFEHQSNGQSQYLSRSWNRVYINFLFEKNDFALSFRPWYRIPEGEKKTTPTAPGNDNPDITDYMGHFELGLAYKLNEDYELSMLLRENFSEHHGALELSLTFPLWGKLRGYVQYFNGYGESLIDYNYKQQRLGIGFALTNIL